MSRHNDSAHKDPANGWEEIAGRFITARHPQTGKAVIEAWAAGFTPGHTLLDIGCGFGGHYTQSLLDLGLWVYGIDASPTLVAEYRSRFPQAEAACESAAYSPLFNRRFDGILAIGLMFLLPPDEQKTLLGKMAGALKPGGRLLFTAPWQVCEWDDLLTGRRSRSLGKAVYVETLRQTGINFVEDFVDEGGNYHFGFLKDMT